MKNKKGFTLIELMAVIVLLGIILAIAIPSVSSISARIKKNMYCTKVEVLENNAQMWGQDNMSGLITLTGSQTHATTGITWPSTSIVTVKKLIDGGYVRSDDVENGNVLNPIDNTSMNNEQIKVYIKNKRVYAKMPSAVEACK